MDWQAKFTQLYGVVDPTRNFPADFDWDDENAIDQLIQDARVHAKTLGQVAQLDEDLRSEEAALRSADAKMKQGNFTFTAAERAALEKRASS